MHEPRKKIRVSTTTSTDRISSLPEDVIHEHIFCHLSDIDIKRMSCLSKTWYHLSTSFPILVLSKPNDDYDDDDDDDDDYDYGYGYGYDFEEKYTARKKIKQSTHNKYLNYIDQTLRGFHKLINLKDDQIILRVGIYLKFRLSRARLVDTWINLVLPHRVEEFNLCLSTPKTPYKKKWMYYNLHPSVFSHPDSIIKVARLRGCSLLHSLPYPNSSPIYKLMIKKLSLNLVLMDETSLRSITSCCPLIEHLSIVDCMDIIKCLRISRLHELKHLIIVRSEENDKRYHLQHSVSVEIAAPSLQTVDIKGSLLSVDIFGKYPILTDLALRNIQKIVLLDIRLFPLLRTLCLYRKFSLIKQNLVNKKLDKCESGLCKNPVTMKIDAPNLHSIVFSGKYRFPRLPASSPSTKLHAVISYSIYAEQTLKRIEDFLFEFSSFISKMEIVEHLDLHFQCDWDKEKCFTFEKVKSKLVQAHGLNIGHFKLFFYDNMKNYHGTVLNVLDAILWTCHPRIFSIQLYGLKFTVGDVVFYMHSFFTRSWYKYVGKVMYVTEDGTEYTMSTIDCKTNFGLFTGEIKFIFDWPMTDSLRHKIKSILDELDKKIDKGDKEKVKRRLEEVLEWIEENQEAEKDDFDKWMNELEEVVG